MQILTLGAIGLGIAWRCIRYFLQFPVWGDEALICLNLLDHSYLELIRPLRFGQVAPVLFLWAESTAGRLLGHSELALRLLPVLAGSTSLLLFCRLARLWLDRRAALFAVTIMAVSYYPVRHSCEVKPYAFDLLAALALLVLSASWLRRPEQIGRLWALTVAIPFILFVSYPAVLVAGGVSLGLFFRMVSARTSFTAKVLYVIFNLLMIVSFIALWALTGSGQHSSMDVAYWRSSFPPSHPAAFISWFMQVHTGNLMAYPLGGAGGASVLTTFLCLGGIWYFWRRRLGAILSLCLIPFLLTLSAAALHKYPYGGSARIAQHLAPAICLLTGAGLSALIDCVRSESHRRAATFGIYAILLLVGLAGLVRDVVRPYKTEDDRFVKNFVLGVFARATPEDQIVILDPIGEQGPTFEWYLRTQARPVGWQGAVDWDHLQRAGDLWCLSFSRNADAEAIQTRVAGLRRPLELVQRETFDLNLGVAQGKQESVTVLHWTDFPSKD